MAGIVDILDRLLSAPLPTLLVLLGAAALGLAAVAGVKDWVKLDTPGRITAGGVGAVLVVVGVVLSVRAQGQPPVGIDAPVGNLSAGGTTLPGNRPADVRKVQALLSCAPVVAGGTPALVVDGYVGEATLRAIEAFQRRQGIIDPDVRVDPGGLTLERLNQLTKTGTPAACLQRNLR